MPVVEISVRTYLEQIEYCKKDIPCSVGRTRALVICREVVIQAPVRFTDLRFFFFFLTFYTLIHATFFLRNDTLDFVLSFHSGISWNHSLRSVVFTKWWETYGHLMTFFYHSHNWTSIIIQNHSSGYTWYLRRLLQVHIKF